MVSRKSLSIVKLVSTIIIFLAFFIAVPMASALEFDNVKDSIDTKGGSFFVGDKEVVYNSIWKTYQPIEITNLFGLGKTLFQGVLTQHDEVCGINCQSTMEIYLAEDSVLIDAIDFYTIKNDGSRVRQNIRSYQFYINNELYFLGDEVKAGIYEVKLEGEKDPLREVDWVISTQGEVLNSWASWRTSLNIGLVSYYNLNETSGAVIDGVGNWNAVNINATTNVTGKIGTAYNFSETGDGVVLNSSVHQDFPNLTVCGWVNPDEIGVGARVWFGGVSEVPLELFKLGINISGNPIFQGYWDGAYKWSLASDTPLVVGTWYFICGTAELNNVNLWVDGVSEASNSSAGTRNLGEDFETYIGKYYTDIAGTQWKGRIDEVGFWNRSLNSSTIVDLYNGGDGVSYGVFGDVEISLNSPINYYNSTENIVIFNCSASYSEGISNVSFYLNGISNETNSSGINNTDYIFTKTLDYDYDEILNWSCRLSNGSWYSDSTIGYLTISEIVNNFETYNSTTAETATEGFRINISSIGDETILANLSYNGTIYPATKVGNDSEMEFYKNLGGIPLITTATGTNHSFFWEVWYGTKNINITANNQSVERTVLGLCNATLDVPYINFTFEDEETTDATNATIDTSTWTYYLGDGTVNKTLLYSTTDANESYGFCFTPTYKTAEASLEFQYSDIGYPQRRWTTSGSLTNTTTDQKLYMLAAADGTYSVYQVQTTTGAGISGVTAQVERQFSGVWVLVEEGETDSAGAATFWLNPDYDHRLTFTKAGYTSIQVTVRPSSSTYTVIMTTGGDTAVYNSSMEGLSWIIYPNLGQILLPNTTQTFSFNITSNLSNIVTCKMQLINNNSVSLKTTTGCTSTGGDLSLSIPLGENRSIRGIYSVDIGDGYFILDADAYWIVLHTNISERGNLKAFFKYARNLNEFGNDANRQEYSRIVFFFLILSIVMGSICYSTGWDFSTAGGAMVFMTFLIWFASYGGFLTLSYTGVNGWMDKYVVALITGLFTGGYMLNKFAREA